MRKIATALILSVCATLGAAACEAPDEPTPVQPAESGKGGEGKSKKVDVPVKLTAQRTPYKRDEFATGGPYTCARVTVVNQSKGNVEVNQFYFAITGEDGEKRQAAVGAAKDEFDTLTLAPGEKATGTVCSETESKPKVVTFTDPLFSEAARAEVAQ